MNQTHVMRHFFKRTLFLLTLLAVVSVNAIGQETWISVKSKNFKFYGNGDRESLSKAANRLEQFRKAFSLLFPTVRLNDPVETKVFYFRSQFSFRPFLPKNRDGTPDKAIVGYFLATESTNYIALSKPKGNVSKGETIYHEYVHYLLNNNFQRTEIPAWLNEGLAEYYSTIQVKEGKKIYLGDLIDSHIFFLRNQRPLPVKRLFEYQNSDIHRSGETNRSIFYAQSWALVHMLAAEKKLDRVGKFVESIRKHKDHKKAFEEVFGLTYNEVDTKLTNYLKQKRFVRQIATLSNNLQIDSNQKFTKLTPAEAQSEMGALSYHKGHYLEAEGYTMKALELDPKNVLANTTMGLMKLQRDQHQEAKKYLEVAIGNGSDNYYAQYSYAYVLSRIGMDGNGFVTGYSREEADKMRNAVLKSIELRPDYVPSYNLLAFVNLVTGKNLKESIGFIQKVLQLQPGNEVAWLTLAQIYVREGRLDEAEEIANRVLKNKPENQTRSTARLVLQNVARAREVDRQNRDFDQRRKSGEIVPAVVVVRDELSDEDVARIQKEREISVMNQSIIRLKPGEKRVLGFVNKIECSKDVVFRVRSKEGKNLVFRSKDFEGLNLMALRAQLGGSQVGCDVRLGEFLAVVNYRQNGSSNLVTAITFVPDDFRFKTEEEIQNDTSVMIIKSPDGRGESKIEVRKAPDNETAEAAEERRRNYKITAIRASLRKPLADEDRKLGVIERIECTSDRMSFILKTEQGMQEFYTREIGKLNIMIFLDNSSEIRIGCGTIPPTEPVVVSFKKQKEADQQGYKIVSVEVVPKGLKLN